VLSLWDGGSLIGQLRFADFAYGKGNFLITNLNGNTFIEPEGTLTPIGGRHIAGVAAPSTADQFLG
jgi:hypothetical protein